MSAVRRMQHHSNTFVFRYAAIRLLEIEIYLDRRYVSALPVALHRFFLVVLTVCFRTAETVARFIEPLTTQNDDDNEDQIDWVSKLAESMEKKFANPDHRAPKDIEKQIHLANSGRIYFEQLHLHPVRIGLTFTQEWMEWNPGAEGMMLFQFIRGMVCSVRF